ncbi:hypothetical protein C2E21_2002 [Chlorella sorokiniana]|uniref:Uncharacterized protein n=1 Tax=Chlorella sorokiniana TaxID=3076 RepID=A0A2P6U0N5_CHLSO|nr:hypothetical protein C2E21_2002 [Chlorella sorokiniana]|eukprot:PRW59882.1 hypothetical protein C2E21_2002 [Chlorella sorokiniana]
MRVLHGVCLAHWEALQALIGRGGYAPEGDGAQTVATELATLIVRGPPALAVDAGVQQLLSKAVAFLQPATTAGDRGEGALRAGQVISEDIQPMLDSLLEAAVDAGIDQSHELLDAYQTAFIQAAVHLARGSLAHAIEHSVQAQVLPPARRLAAALLDWWRRPEAQPAAALELAQAAAARSCAYLRCANLGGEGGPAAGQGAGSQRCRVGGIAIVRLGHLLLGGATMTGPPEALHHAATPGWAGMLRDFMRLLLGTRILHVATVAVALQQPVLATTLQQALLLLASDVSGYCGSQLLSDPLTHRRLARLEGWLSTLLAGPLGLPLAGLPQAAATSGSNPRILCVSMLTFLNITMMLLLPVLLVAWRGAAWAAADAQLAALCSGQGLDWLHKLLLAHGLLSLLWLLSIAVGFDRGE